MSLLISKNHQKRPLPISGKGLANNVQLPSKPEISSRNDDLICTATPL